VVAKRPSLGADHVDLRVRDPGQHLERPRKVDLVHVRKDQNADREWLVAKRRKASVAVSLSADLRTGRPRTPGGQPGRRADHRQLREAAAIETQVFMIISH